MGHLKANTDRSQGGTGWGYAGVCLHARVLLVFNYKLKYFNCRNIIGYHNNFHTGALFNPRLMLHQVAAAMFPKWVLGEEHYKHFTPMWKGISHLMQETGYLHLQSTKPETIGMLISVFKRRMEMFLTNAQEWL